MDLAEVLLIAFALAMDAFAVALSTGAYLVRVNVRQTFRLVFHFGLFQFFMPILGWVAGAQLLRFMSAFDHWIAFALLAFIGGRMVSSAFQTRADEIRGDVTRGMSLVALSVATSIDALAVGLSLAVIDTPIVFPSLIIGLIAAFMTFLGLRLGERFSAAFGKKMELAGGIILICIGAKILFEHLV
jgi:manganese efflux pump family protein